jgi:hypothetical protein
MSGMPHTDHFDLFGVGLAISADDPEIRSAIRSRLRRFTASQPSPDELTIELDLRELHPH